MVSNTPYVRAHINKIVGNTRIGRESKRSPARFRSRSIPRFSSPSPGRSARDQFRRATSDRATRAEKERTGRREAPATSEFALRSVRRTSSSCRCFSALRRFFPRAITPPVRAISARELPRNDDVQPSIIRREGERDRKHLRPLMES